jgi:RNA polymerase sigma-70 factor (ECF subfamily)
MPLPAAASLEAEVLESLRKGDRGRALALLMRTHGAAVYRFCAEQLGDREEAQDVLQNVFIQAFRSLHEYEPRSTLRAWLFGIARHRCLDARKSRGRWLRIVDAQAQALPERADTAPDGDARLEAKRLAAALEECVQRLTPKLREAVLLRVRADLTYEEMADACGEQIGTLRVRVARALPTLQECLEAKEMGR